MQTLPETTFGGDFATPTDYLDPLIQQNLAGDNFAVFPLNRYHHSTINASEPSPRDRAARTCSAPTTAARPARAAALRLPPLRGVRAHRHGDRFPDRHPVRRDPGLLRRLDRHRDGALQRDLERHADALHADHLLVAVLAASACWSCCSPSSAGSASRRTCAPSSCATDPGLRARRARLARATGPSSGATSCRTA